MYYVSVDMALATPMPRPCKLTNQGIRRIRTSQGRGVLSSHPPPDFAMSVTAAAGIPRLGLGRRDVVVGLLGFAAACCVNAYLAVSQAAQVSEPDGRVWQSPRRQLAGAEKAAVASLPYPPDALPGGRLVETPYGSIQVYEWGPEAGEKVLLVPGISTPVLALGNLGHELARRGYRVMMFGTTWGFHRLLLSILTGILTVFSLLLLLSAPDLFGRGWSDCPVGVAHDVRLYVSQILLVVTSSPLPWTGRAQGFHLMGYSFGGALSAAFTRYLPHLVRSLTLITPGGLIRRHHVGWKSRLLYSRGLLPERLLAMLVRRRLRQPQEQTSRFGGNSDVHGGDGFDSAVLAKDRPEVTVAAVCSWQLEQHQGFLPAFMDSLRDAPIYEQQALWRALSRQLATRRADADADSDADAEAAESDRPSRKVGKALLIVGSADPVVVKEEVIPDVHAALGDEGVDVVIIEGGHEIPITESTAIAEAAVQYWSTAC